MKGVTFGPSQITAQSNTVGSNDISMWQKHPGDAERLTMAFISIPADLEGYCTHTSYNSTKFCLRKQKSPQVLQNGISFLNGHTSFESAGNLHQPARYEDKYKKCLYRVSKILYALQWNEDILKLGLLTPTGLLSIKLQYCHRGRFFKVHQLFWH